MRYYRASVSGLCLVIGLALSGCMDGGGSGVEGARPGQVVERDIEAPNVFSKRDRALWDGRPSLGGVWVAHPDVRAPERVIIRNTENGRETIGALFKRERMNPGPVFQVSADAASAVGMLAGAPTNIEVIALRTEEIRTGPVEEPATEPAAVAAAPASAPAPAPAPLQAATTETAAQTDLIALPDDTAEAAPRTGLFSRLFRRSETPAETGDAIDVQPLGDAPATVIADAPLPMPTPTPMPSPAAAAPASAAASGLAQPFIQLGIFSVEANAQRAQKLASDAGLSARVVAGQSRGNNFWRVVVGPASDAAESASLLARVKALGFNDAYTVRR